MKVYLVIWPTGEKTPMKLFIFANKQKAEELINKFHAIGTTGLWPSLDEMEVIE